MKYETSLDKTNIVFKLYNLSPSCCDILILAGWSCCCDLLFSVSRQGGGLDPVAGICSMAVISTTVLDFDRHRITMKHLYICSQIVELQYMATTQHDTVQANFPSFPYPWGGLRLYQLAVLLIRSTSD